MVGWLKQEWRIVLFGFVLMFFSSAGQTYFIALFGGEIRSSLDLSHGEFGSLYSLATLVSAVVLLASGRVLDWMRLHWVVMCLSIGLSIAAWTLSQAQSVLALFCALFLLRHFGQGLTGMCSVTTMMRYVPAHRAKANALSYTGYSAAEAILPSVVVALLLLMDWRSIWAVVSVLALLALPLLTLSLLQWHRRARHLVATRMSQSDAEVSAHATGTQRQWTRREVMRDPAFYCIVPGLTCQSLLYTGFMFHQVVLVEQKGWSLAVWASLYTIFATVSITMNFVISAVIDRTGTLKLIPWMNLPMMIGLLLLATTDALWGAALFMVCMGISTAAQAAASGPFYSEQYGVRHLGAIKSLGSFVMVLMTALSPIVMGALIDGGTRVEVLAYGGIGYAMVVSLLAALGCGWSRQRISTMGA